MLTSSLAGKSIARKGNMEPINLMTGRAFRPVATLTHAAFLRAAVLLLTFGPCMALAEDPTIVHPFLTDRVTIEAGLYFPNKDFKARVDGTVSNPDREIDFESELGNRTSDDVFDVELLWRLSHKWSVAASHFSADSSGDTVLQQDIQWGDTAIQQGSQVSAGNSFDLTRVLLGYALDSDIRHDFGVGIGLHWLDTAAFLRGDINVVATSSSDVRAAGPLPNIGAWYYYSMTPKFCIGGRLDWFKASVGDYGGKITNFAFGGNYQVSRHFGIGAKFQEFTLAADIRKSSWKGRVNLRYSGMFFFLSGSW